jgi:predicted amidohydrolase
MSDIRVGVVQFAPTDSLEANLAVIRAEVASLSACDLIVLPEYSAWYRPDPMQWRDGGGGEPVDLVWALSELSSATGATFVAGSLVLEDGVLRNRVLVVSAVGVVAAYDKVHLYDAFGAKESDVIAAGDPAAPAVVIDVKGVRVGVQTCYDIRFPEVSRRLIDAGAEVLVVPADWVPGEHKVEHWETLLRARAIENLAWVVAADHAAPSGIGHSMVVDPLGVVVDRLDTVAGSFAVTISSEAVADARRTNPALEMRRYWVEPR